jgi:hypothetical protein
MSDSTADGRLVQNILDVVFAPLHEDEKAPHDWLVRMKTGIDRHLRKHAFEREGLLTKGSDREWQGPGVRRPTTASDGCASRPTSRIQPVGHQ